MRAELFFAVRSRGWRTKYEAARHDAINIGQENDRSIRTRNATRRTETCKWGVGGCALARRARMA